MTKEGGAFILFKSFYNLILNCHCWKKSIVRIFYCDLNLLSINFFVKIKPLKLRSIIVFFVHYYFHSILFIQRWHPITLGFTDSVTRSKQTNCWQINNTLVMIGLRRSRDSLRNLRTCFMWQYSSDPLVKNRHTSLFTHWYAINKSTTMNPFLKFYYF